MSYVVDVTDRLDLCTTCANIICKSSNVTFKHYFCNFCKSVSLHQSHLDASNQLSVQTVKSLIEYEKIQAWIEKNYSGNFTNDELDDDFYYSPLEWIGEISHSELLKTLATDTAFKNYLIELKNEKNRP